MGGAFVTPEQYDRLTDWDIIHVYLAPRDDEGALVTLKRRISRARLGGLPEDAQRELPSVEELQVPREALLLGVPMDYTLMFFQVWRARGLDAESTMAKFREKVKEVPPNMM